MYQCRKNHGHGPAVSANLVHRQIGTVRVVHLDDEVSIAVILDEAEGTVFGSINRRQLESLSLPCISSGEGVVVERKLGSLEAVIGSALAESTTLEATRDSLLPALMSGRLRVKDAERQVEEVL